MYERYLLSDKGIKKAVEEGKIKISPPVKDEQIQPATLDIFFKKFDDWENILSDVPAGDTNEHLLGSQISGCAMATQSVILDEHIGAGIELRSTLRRIGLQYDSELFIWGKNYEACADVRNPTRYGIRIPEGFKFAQIFFYPEPEYYPELDRGFEVNKEEEIEELQRKGLFKIEPELDIKDGYIVVHASEKARKFNPPDIIDVSDKNLKRYFEEFDTTNGVELNPGDHIDFETVEKIDLSKHIGIRFYRNLPIPTAMENLHKKEEHDTHHFIDFFESLGADAGWVDPGYCGYFSVQPKKYFTREIIKPGDILALGQLVYFPDGVERPYGSKGLNSHFQNHMP